MDDRWLSVDEIAEYLGVAKDTIYTWVTSKRMPGHKVGRFWKFKKEDVDIWVREGGAAASSDDFENEASVEANAGSVGVKRSGRNYNKDGSNG